MSCLGVGNCVNWLHFTQWGVGPLVTKWKAGHAPAECAFGVKDVCPIWRLCAPWHSLTPFLWHAPRVEPGGAPAHQNFWLATVQIKITLLVLFSVLVLFSLFFSVYLLPPPLGFALCAWLHLHFVMSTGSKRLRAPGVEHSATRTLILFNLS